SKRDWSSDVCSSDLKIGIRPTIDGRRRGVRESLEGQTMGLAQRVAEMLSAELRHRDGSAVECVIADTAIGGVAEAAACAEKFSREGGGLTITEIGRASWRGGT